jgi:hypothetical protein
VPAPETTMPHLALLPLLLAAALTVPDVAPVDIGTRWELWLDRALLSDLDGATLQLQTPVRRETVFTFDAPWEGPWSGYCTVLHDGQRWRLYYRGGGELTREYVCLAYSDDAVHWTRPALGLFEHAGSRDNNIVWTGREPAYCEAHSFTPFLDRNPATPTETRWKAVALTRAVPPGEQERRAVLVGFVSADGLRWQRLSDAPLLTQGSFDSQNTAFWDAARNSYVCYFRTSRDGKRAISRATSADFIHWSDPQPLDYGAAPLEHFYTNAVLPYPRAPHLLIGLPMRFVPPQERNAVGDPPRPTDGLSDAVFMASRDGVHWSRLFMEAFLRPGPDPCRWGGAHGNNTPAWGLAQTGPAELSLYWSENYDNFTGTRPALTRVPQLARGTLRVDGFVALHAGYAGGAARTVPLVFTGRRLVLNCATSAVGSVRVELQDAGGAALPGFALADAPEIWGDEIERPVRWHDVSALAGHPVRLRLVLKDADVFAFRFVN